MPATMMMVSLRVKPQQEAAFTDYYHHRYLPQLLDLVPEITAIRRYEESGVEGSLAWFRKRHLTIYEMATDDPAAALAAGLSRAAGEALQADWDRLRERAVPEVEQVAYRQTWRHDREPGDGPFGGRPFFMVSVETDPAEEESFRDWYETDYLPKTMADIPTFVACRRYTSLGRKPERSHTIYEAADEAGLARSFQLLRAPWRFGSNEAWAGKVGQQITWQDTACWRPIFRRPG